MILLIVMDNIILVQVLHQSVLYMNNLLQLQELLLIILILLHLTDLIHLLFEMQMEIKLILLYGQQAVNIKMVLISLQLI